MAKVDRGTKKQTTARADTRSGRGDARVRRSKSSTWLPLVAVVAVISLVGICSALCFSSKRSDSRASQAETLRAEQSPPRASFTEITQQAGIDFVHINGASGEKLLPETMGGGSAFLDFDNDGDQDLLMIQSGRHLAGGASRNELARLYRNDGTGRFKDVTAGSGLDQSVDAYGMGVAIGDFDNDERVDVFVSAVGMNRLYRNLGGGKFEDVTKHAGIGGASDAWSTACGWFDYDNDGDLDLFVCNYLDWSPEFDRAGNFRLVDGRKAYGRPQSFAGAFPYLYRNEGLGRFTEVSKEAGLHVIAANGLPAAKSLGLAFEDIDGDGWLDILVANDTVPNQYFRNRGNGEFEERGFLAGLALDEQGNARGAMGIDVGTVVDAESLAVVIGNFAHEMVSWFVSSGRSEDFRDLAPRTELGNATLDRLTFGVCYIDFDLDGGLDIFAVNGHLEPDIERVQPGQHYRQMPQLFWNSSQVSRGHYREVTARHDETWSRPLAGRGVNYADIDGDGDLDCLITAVGESPRLLRNDSTSGHHWLRLRLEGASSNASAIGAKVEVRTAEHTLVRRVMPTRSYLTQVELPLTFGLGDSREIRSITVTWPNGKREQVSGATVNRAFIIREGTGEAEAVVTRKSDDQVSTGPQLRSVPTGSWSSWSGYAQARSCGNYLLNESESGQLPATPEERHDDASRCGASKGEFAGGITPVTRTSSQHDYAPMMHSAWPTPIGAKPRWALIADNVKPHNLMAGIWRPPQ